MGLLLIALVWVLNFAISIWNSYVCGKVWVESKVMGGWVRFMVWMGATMAACGFSWCYLIFLALTAYHFEWINQTQLEVSLNLGYIILVPVILFAGTFIWIDSLIQAWRQRDLPSMGIAAWNTFAQIHNTYSAIQGFGPAFSSVFDFFSSGGKDKSSSSDDDKDNSAAILMVVALVAVALLGGVLTTAAIIKMVAGNQPLPPRPDHLPDRREYAER